MRVSGLSHAEVGTRLLCWRTGAAFLGLALLWGVGGPSVLHAQQWRGRVATRVQYVEARGLVLDSVSVDDVTGGKFGDIWVTCTTGEDYCYYYRSGSEFSTVPVFVDLDMNVFALGVEGLRFYASTRFRGALGANAEKFWPRTEDNFDLLAAYAELNRPSYRLRLGRDYQSSGLGYYGYDGGSILYRYRPVRLELEAYGGWGLERGLPERVTSGALKSLGDYQPLDDNYLFGFRGSVGPVKGFSAEAIYQREIETDRSGISSDRLGFEARYTTPNRKWLIDAHADYDLAAGWWGKAGAKLGYQANDMFYLEGRLFRYRPVFSLQSIWVAFSPTPYTGWGFALGVNPGYGLTIRAEVDRRQYGDTEAEVPYFTTTDRTWRTGAWARWQPRGKWDVEGGYWLNWGFGAGMSAGDLKFNYYPRSDLQIGARFSASQQIWEFRIGENFIYGLGVDARWQTPAGTLWALIEGYKHDRSKDAAQTDWTQLRAVFGISYYLGSEPGRSQ
ncbi:MAG: hypothetical protein JSV86_12275 [Gemmatimonadota bacterium]|nr:MAG: hypothetical protein JSV86_12275 [Gemmatimonadota bacterium]